jgi:uncharacterized membrane protein YheB (UPF0754 family)
VGEVVATELLSWNQIAVALDAPEIRTGVAAMAGQAVAERFNVYPLLLPLPQGLRKKLSAFVAKTVTREVHEILAGGGSEMAAKMFSSVNLAGLVEERLESMDWDYLEQIVYGVAGRELKLIEVMGGILGALVGLFQALAVVLF